MIELQIEESERVVYEDTTKEQEQEINDNFLKMVKELLEKAEDKEYKLSFVIFQNGQVQVAHFNSNHFEKTIRCMIIRDVMVKGINKSIGRP